MHTFSVGRASLGLVATTGLVLAGAAIAVPTFAQGESASPYAGPTPSPSAPEPPTMTPSAATAPTVPAAPVATPTSASPAASASALPSASASAADRAACVASDADVQTRYPGATAKETTDAAGVQRVWWRDGLVVARTTNGTGWTEACHVS